MPRTLWPLHQGRPMVQVTLNLAQGGNPVIRRLLADTGAGNAAASFELILDENDCLLCGGRPSQDVILSGAYSGAFPIYLIRVQVPTIGFDRYLPTVGVPSLPQDFDGIACFKFLNRFTYSNFSNSSQFGLET